MVDRIWLKSYPAGMPAEIDADLFASIPDVLAKLAVKFDDKPAYHNLGRTMSYAELDRLLARFRRLSCRDCPAWRRAIASPSCRPTCCNTRSRCSASCAPA